MTNLTKKKQKELLIQETILKLKAIFEEEGFDVYCKNHHTSRSGMMRVIEFFTASGTDLTEYFHILTGYNFHNKYHGLRVTGCGMDMGFHVTYLVSSKIYRDELTDGYSKTGAYKLQTHWS